MILDHFNYKLKKESLIHNFFSRKHLKSTIIFLIGAIITTGIVDYLFGIKLFYIWLWSHYSLFYWIILYIIINFIFIILVYETYKIIKYFIFKKIKVKKIIIRNKLKVKKIFVTIAAIGFIIPLINYIFFGINGINYTILLPFISVFFLSQAFLIKFKTPITFDIIRYNKALIYSVLITVF